MPRIKLTLEYDGTDYVGWQVQLNGVSVQSVMERTLSELLGEAISVEAAGRTDSGVHALGQVIAFTTSRTLPMKAYWRGLSGMLPPDIAVVKAEQVSEDFDPRRWSKGKRYRYLISNRETKAPLRRRTHWELYGPLDVEAMRKGASHLLGRHDFTAFRAGDCAARTAVREIRVVDISEREDQELAITVEGTAFLKHMVRNIVGTLVEVGRGKQPPEWVGEVLASKDRSRAGATAPAHGLTMVEVFYGATPSADSDDEDC
ncbi:MAG: tRNA pseudouridine(38-40) synthase TruA [Myxococcaceae bacterium]